MKYLLTIAFLLMATPSFAVNLKTYTVCESGCDYTTVQAAETAHDQDLVANDSALTFEIQNTWASPDGTTSVNSSVADATRFMTFIAVGAARATATWSTTAYRGEGSGSIFSIGDQYVVVDGLQLRSTETGATSSRIFFTIDKEYTISNCFIKGNTGSDITGIGSSNLANTVAIIRNNVIIDCTTEGIDAQGFAGGGVKVDNNTIENCAIGIITLDNEIIARNNILWNCTTPLSGNFNTTTLSEENFTDAGSLSYGSCGSCGTGDQLSQSDPFENIGGENYLLASGATAIDAGKDLSGDFTDAIGGKTRDANFDKGADEFIAAGGGQKVMIRK